MSLDFMVEHLEVKYVYPMYKEKKSHIRKPFYTIDIICKCCMCF